MDLGQALQEQFASALRERKPLSLIMLDVDKFKAVNDRYGHPAGDRVLRALAQLLSSAARPTDLAARYGGEEFALLMPGAARATVSAIAESIRRAIASKPIACEKAGAEASGSVLASDAFFPFPDGVEAAAQRGVTAVVQPGGSVKDADVVAAADRAGIAMVMTGVRHFRH